MNNVDIQEISKEMADKIHQCYKKVISDFTKGIDSRYLYLQKNGTEEARKQFVADYENIAKKLSITGDFKPKVFLTDKIAKALMSGDFFYPASLTGLSKFKPEERVLNVTLSDTYYPIVDYRSSDFKKVVLNFIFPKLNETFRETMMYSAFLKSLASSNVLGRRLSQDEVNQYTVPTLSSDDYAIGRYVNDWGLFIRICEHLVTQHEYKYTSRGKEISKQCYVIEKRNDEYPFSWVGVSGWEEKSLREFIKVLNNHNITKISNDKAAALTVFEFFEFKKKDTDYFTRDFYTEDKNYSGAFYNVLLAGGFISAKQSEESV